MRRAAGSLIVPLVLLVAIGGWFWLSWATAGEPATLVTARPTVAATAATAAIPVAAETATSAPQGIVGLATPWGAAGLEPTAAATVSPVTVRAITLFGPPAGSRFGRDDAVSFYWSWPEALAEGQRFVLYLSAAGESRPLGQIDEANLGRAYHFNQTVGETGDFRWEVVLEDEATGAIIGRSESRTITILGG